MKDKPDRMAGIKTSAQLTEEFNALKNARYGAQAKCGNCFHAFLQPQGNQEILVCYEAPPQWQMVATPQGAAMQQLIRGVDVNFFCSRFKPSTSS